MKVRCSERVLGRARMLILQIFGCLPRLLKRKKALQARDSWRWHASLTGGGG